MIVCIDSGNTRIKWGVHDGSHWLAQGAVAQADAVRLGQLLDEWQVADRVVLANVAGVEVERQIRDGFAAWPAPWIELRSEFRRCGVTNLYRQPEKLGVDRWCALIGARALAPSAAFVVMAGTATTIDTLDADGSFLGGMILPGMDLMRRALSTETAALPLAAGEYTATPRCTDDAIVTGVVEAQVGAIERAWRRLDAVDKQCLLSGGNAPTLIRHLDIPCREIPNLPLEGMARIGLGA
jgi:type III pantothenate kinase